MKYTLEVKQCNSSGCRNIVSRRDDEVVQEFHVRAGDIDQCIAEWKKLFTEDELAQNIAEVLRHDIC
jgi:hypothetical protein